LIPAIVLPTVAIICIPAIILHGSGHVVEHTFFTTFLTTFVGFTTFVAAFSGILLGMVLRAEGLIRGVGGLLVGKLVSIQIRRGLVPEIVGVQVWLLGAFAAMVGISIVVIVITTVVIRVVVVVIVVDTSITAAESRVGVRVNWCCFRTFSCGCGGLSFSSLGSSAGCFRVSYIVLKLF